MGLDLDFQTAFAKAQIAAGTKLPTSGKVFVSVRDIDKAAIVDPVRKLIDLGFSIVATRGTAAMLADAGLQVEVINKVLEGRPHIVDAMKNDDIDMLINTTEGAQALADSFEIRRTALTNSMPYFTTVAGASAAVQGISALSTGALEVSPLQSYAML